MWAAACLLAIAGAWYRFAELGTFTNDHFVHLALAQQMWLGDRPLRDFADPGMPLMYWLSALVQVPFGRGLLGEAVLTSGMLGLGAAFTFLALRRLLGTSWPALAGGLLVILMRPRHYSYPKIVVFAAAIWLFASYAERPSRGRAAALGLLIAAAFLFRHDLGVYLGLATAVALVLTHAPRLVDGLRRTALAMAVALACLAPYLVYIEREVGLAEYMRAGVAFSALENTRTRSAMPAFETSDSFVSDRNAETWLFYAVLLLPVAGIVVLVLPRAWMPERQERFRGALAAVSVLGAVLAYSFVREARRARLADIAVPLAVLGAWLCWLALRGSWRRPSRAVAQLGALALAAITVAAALVVGEAPIYIARAVERGASMEIEHVRALATHLAVAPPARNIDAASATDQPRLARYLLDCLADDDRALIVGFIPQAFVLSGHGFAGGHPRFVYGMLRRPSEQRQMMAWLERESVPIIIESTGASVAEYPLLFARLRRHYEAPVRFGDQISIYAARDRPPARVWSVSPLPCYR